MNQNSKVIEIQNHFQTQYKNYIIEINKDEKERKLIIKISLNNISHTKDFSFEDIKKIDFDFFYPFENNLLLLYKYIVRLLRAKLFDITTNNEKMESLSLCLYCLKNNKIKTIIINIPSNKYSQENGIILSENKNINLENANSNNFIDNNNGSEEDRKNKNEDYNIGSAPAPKINKKKNKYEYKIYLKKIKNLYQKTKEYREIEIKIEQKIINKNNEEKKIIYYDYLDSQDIFGASITYYNLFDFSIDDVFDDLNIIFYHKNYRFEQGKDCIKLFFNVFNFGEGNPYIEIFIQALNRERNNQEISIKMNRFFSEFQKGNIVNNNGIKSNKNKKEKNINNESKKDISKGKKVNKENYSQNFLNSFLKLNKNDNFQNRNDENIINGSFKKNNFNPINEEIKKNIIKDNSNNQKFLNIYKNEDNKKDNINYTKHKRYNDFKLEYFFTAEGDKEFENENYIKKEKKDTKLIENCSLKIEEDNEIEEKNEKCNCNYELKEKSDSFKLDNNNLYNIDKESVINDYINIFYNHPLDNNEELEKIINSQKKEFYLCKICKFFDKTKDKIRIHQWDKHLKPFGKIIRRRLVTLQKIIWMKKKLQK